MTIEEIFSEKTTNELQKGIKHSGFNAEAEEIAKRILKSRGASIPAPLTDEEIEKTSKAVSKASNLRFLGAVASICGGIFYIVHNDLLSISNEGDAKRLSQAVFTSGLLTWLFLKKSIKEDKKRFKD